MDADPGLPDIVVSGTLAEVKVRVGPRARDWRGQGGQSLLFWAARRTGDAIQAVDVCRFLVESAGLEVNLPSAADRPYLGRTPLFLAAKCAPVQVVEFLLERRADCDHVDGGKQTPLFFATYNCVEVLELLLERRADPSRRDQHSQTPMFYAAKAENARFVEALLRVAEAGAAGVRDCILGQTPLFYAVQDGVAETCTLLIAGACGVDIVDYNGQSALFWAAKAGKAEVVELLLESQASVDLRDRNQETALFYAAHSNMLETCRLLVEKGRACPSVQNVTGRSPLDMAMALGSERSQELLSLFAKEAQRKVPSTPSRKRRKCEHPEEEKTPSSMAFGASSAAEEPKSDLPALLLAARRGDVAKVQELLSARGDVGFREERSGRTALHEAVEAKQLKVCRALLESDADPQAQDTEGVTPLARAKDVRWAVAVREMEHVNRQRKQRAEREKQAQAAAHAQSLRQLAHIVKHGPLEQVRELLAAAESGTLSGESGAALLHAAAGRPAGSMEVCKLMLEELKMAPGSKTAQGQAALFPAACGGNAEACGLLVQQRCEVDGCDAGGRTALFGAAGTGHAAVLRTLLRCRANVHWRDSMNQTALFFAACKSAECVSLLLEAHGSASCTDSLGQSPLFYASRDGVDKAVQMLVDARADVNRMDHQGKPALFFAIREGQAGTAAVLLDTCDAWPPEDRSRGGCDLVAMARNRGLLGIVGQLQAKARLREALLSAARGGTVEDVDKAIAQGASMSAVNAAGWSALHCAAARKDAGGLQCLRRLVERHGADVNALDRQQQTPLFVAARDAPKECVAYLLDSGCNLCLADDRGDTALFDAAQKRRPDIVALLLERRACAEHTGAGGQTAAFRAAAAGSAAALGLLLEHRACAGATDAEGRTALFGVQDADCAGLLLQQRCDVDARDAALRTALFEAEGCEIPRLLLRARAAANGRDGQRQTALFVAAARGDAAAARALLEAGADGSALDSAGQSALFSAAPRAPLDIVRLLVCEAWVNPAIKDAKGLTAAQVARRARPAAKAGVVEYLSRAVRSLPSLDGEKPRRYRFAFVDPTDKSGVVPFGTPEYEEALARLAKSCPWLKAELWLPATAPAAEEASVAAEEEEDEEEEEEEGMTG